MRARMVFVRVVREFPHPAEDCYRWLTDYSDEDPRLAGAVLKERRVLERHDDRVVLEVHNEVLGRPMRGRGEVRLFPGELRYEARSLEGDGGAILYTYQLTPLGPARTRLEVRYGTRVRRVSRWLQIVLARPIIRRRLHRMWDGFARAMDADLRAPTAAAPASPRP